MNTTCGHAGPFDDGNLICTRTDHTDNSHTYESTSAGDAEAGSDDE